MHIEYNPSGDSKMRDNGRTLLGHGVYSLKEAAHYTELHHARVRSWFVKKRGRSSVPLFQFDYHPVGHHYAVSFHDLIDVLVAGRLREKGVPMSEIRAAHAILKHTLKTPHPFCHELILTDGKKIFVDTADEMGSERLAEVLTGQGIFEKVIRPYLEHIEYEKKLARRWAIMPGVVLDPATNLGKPSVSGAGISTYVLTNCYRANGRDVGFVADMFEMEENEVRAAVQFEEQYGVAA